MTKEDIIQTAFRVWAKELYQTTSLSDIARELGVSKPALYRHFRDKDDLLRAMAVSYFDDCAAFIKTGYEQAAAAGGREGGLIMMHTIAEYNIRNRPAFIFSMVQAFGAMDRETLGRELRERGIDIERLALREQGGSYPGKFQLALGTLIFIISNFHKTRYKKDEIPTEKLIADTIAQVETSVTKGLCLDPRDIAGLDYAALEKRIADTAWNDSDGSALLEAVAGAVAEAGPWNASMEMVARRSGLSKSGLYAHFKNKQDMMGRFFITEFTRIANYAKSRIETTHEPAEQLYLAIISIVNYLRSRPEILLAMDWIKNRPLELGKEVNDRLFGLIGSIKLEAVRQQNRQFLVSVAQWILFLILNTLAWWPGANSEQPRNAPVKSWAKNAAEIPNESLRVLFRFISLGLEGLINE